MHVCSALKGRSGDILWVWIIKCIAWIIFGTLVSLCSKINNLFNFDLLLLLFMSLWKMLRLSNATLQGFIF